MMMLVNNFCNKYLKLLIAIVFFFAINIISSSNLYSQEFSIEKAKTVIADYIQSRFIAMNRKIISANGKMMLTLDDGLCLKMEHPYSNVWRFNNNGEKISVELNDKSGNNKQDPFLANFILLMKNILAGNVNLIYEQFDVETYSDDKEFDLKPKDEKLSRFISNIEIVLLDNKISRVKVIEHSGNFTEFSFRNVVNFQENLLLSDFCRVEN